MCVTVRVFLFTIKALILLLASFLNSIFFETKSSSCPKSYDPLGLSPYVLIHASHSSAKFSVRTFGLDSGLHAHAPRNPRLALGPRTLSQEPAPRPRPPT